MTPVRPEMGGTTTATQALLRQSRYALPQSIQPPQKSYGPREAKEGSRGLLWFCSGLSHSTPGGQQWGESAIHCYSLFCSSLSTNVGFLVRQVCSQLLSQANFSGNHSPWTWEEVSKQANATCPVGEVEQRRLRFLRLPNKEVILKPGGKGRSLLVTWEGCADSGRVGSVYSKLSVPGQGINHCKSSVFWSVTCRCWNMGLCGELPRILEIHSKHRLEKMNPFGISRFLL